MKLLTIGDAVMSKFLLPIFIHFALINGYFFITHCSELDAVSHHDSQRMRFKTRHEPLSSYDYLKKLSSNL